jgi:hypothetical protein
MAAHRASQQHIQSCGDCVSDADRCPQGQRLYDEFVRLQDDYLARQRKQR